MILIIAITIVMPLATRKLPIVMMSGTRVITITAATATTIATMMTGNKYCKGLCEHLACMTLLFA